MKLQGHKVFDYQRISQGLWDSSFKTPENFENRKDFNIYVNEGRRTTWVDDPSVWKKALIRVYNLSAGTDLIENFDKQSGTISIIWNGPSVEEVEDLILRTEEYGTSSIFDSVRSPEPDYDTEEL